MGPGGGVALTSKTGGGPLMLAAILYAQVLLKQQLVDVAVGI